MKKVILIILIWLLCVSSCYAYILNMGNDDCAAGGAASDCSQTWTSLIQQAKFDDQFYPSYYTSGVSGGATYIGRGWEQLYHSTTTNSAVSRNAQSFTIPSTGITSMEYYVYFPETFASGDLVDLGWKCNTLIDSCASSLGFLVLRFIKASSGSDTSIKIYSSNNQSTYSTPVLCAHTCSSMPVAGDIWFIRLGLSNSTDTIYWYVERNNTPIYNGSSVVTYSPATAVAPYIYNRLYTTGGDTIVYYWGGYTFLDDTNLILYGAATNSSAKVVDEGNVNVSSCVNESAGSISIDLSPTYDNSTIDQWKHQGRILYYTQQNCAGNVIDQFPGHGEISTQIFQGNKYKIVSSINQTIYESMFKELMWGAWKANQIAGGYDLGYTNSGEGDDGQRYGFSVGQWLGAKCPTGLPCSDNSFTWNGNTVTLTSLFVTIAQGAHTQTHDRIASWLRMGTLYYGRKAFADETLLTTALKDSWTNTAETTIETGSTAPDDNIFSLNTKVWMRGLYLDADIGNRSIGTWLRSYALDKGYFNTTDITTSVAIDDTSYAALGGMTSSDYLYISRQVGISSSVIHPIDALKIIMGPTVNANTATLNMQYCTANSDVTTPCDTWTGIPGGFVDGTAVAGKTLAQSGEIYLSDPNSFSNWIQSRESGSTTTAYYVRMYPSATLSTTVNLDLVEYRGEYQFDCSSGASSCNLTKIYDARAGYGLWDEQFSDADLDHYDNYSQLIVTGLANYLIDGGTFRSNDVGLWVKETLKAYSGLLDVYGKGVLWGRSIGGGSMRLMTAAYLQGFTLGFIPLDQLGLIKKAMDMYILDRWNKGIYHRWAYVWKDVDFAGSSVLQESYMTPSTLSGHLMDYINFPELFIDNPNGTYWDSASTPIRSEQYNYGELLGTKLAYHTDYADQLVLLLNAGNRNNSTSDYLICKYTQHFWANIFYASVGTTNGSSTGTVCLGYGYAAPVMTGVTPVAKNTTITLGLIGDGLTPLAYQTGTGYEYTAIAVDNHFVWVTKYTPTGAATSNLWSLPLAKSVYTTITTDVGTDGACQTGVGKTVCFKALKSETSPPTVTANTRDGFLYAQANRVNMDSSAIKLNTGSKSAGTTYYEIFDMGLDMGTLSYTSFNGYSSFVSSSTDDHQVNSGTYRVYLRTGTAKNEATGYTVGNWTIKGGTMRGFAGSLTGDDKFGGIGINEIKYLGTQYLACTADCNATFDALNPEVQLGLIKVKLFGSSGSLGTCGTTTGAYVTIKSIAFTDTINFVYGKNIDSSWQLLTSGTDYLLCSGDLIIPYSTINTYDFPVAEFKVNAALIPPGDRPFNSPNSPWNYPWTEEKSNETIMSFISNTIH